jgi:hypothetical protein
MVDFVRSPKKFGYSGALLEAKKSILNTRPMMITPVTRPSLINVKPKRITTTKPQPKSVKKQTKKSTEKKPPRKSVKKPKKVAGKRK